MTAAEMWGLILSGGGLIASVWAAVQAGGAKKAVSRILGKADAQHDRDKALNLLKVLNNAKAAAIGRKQGASRLASNGRSKDSDLRDLQLAQDELATVTFGTGENLTAELRTAASELNRCLSDIGQPNSTRDGWGDALECLQSIVPKIENEQRKWAKSGLT